MDTKEIAFHLMSKKYWVTNFPEKVFNNKLFQKTLENKHGLQVDFSSAEVTDKENCLVCFFITVAAKEDEEEVYAWIKKNIEDIEYLNK